jgi:hypothetical protein
MLTKTSVVIAITWSFSSITPIFALSPQEVGQVAKFSTVRIVTSQGAVSGVIIQRQSNQYTVLTTAQVSPQRELAIFTADGRRHQANNWRTFSPTVDLATLTFTSRNDYRSAVIVNSSLLKGKSIFIAGFPRPTRTITAPVYTIRTGQLEIQGNVASSGPILSYKANLLPGMEGGGIFDDSGQLVGVHYRRVAQNTSSDTVNSNVQFQTSKNTGIPIGSFISAASNNGSDTYSPPPSRSGGTPSVAEVEAFRANAQRIQGGAMLTGAQASYDKGRYQEAITMYDRYIKAHPQDASAYGSRGNAKFAMGNKRGALGDFDQALQLNPKLVQALRNRAIVKASLGDNKGAVADIRKAVQLQPQEAEFHYLLGIGLYEQGDRQGSIQSLQRSIGLYKSRGDSTNAQKVTTILNKIKSL